MLSPAGPLRASAITAVLLVASACSAAVDTLPAPTTAAIAAASGSTTTALTATSSTTGIAVATTEPAPTSTGAPGSTSTTVTATTTTTSTSAPAPEELTSQRPPSPSTSTSVPQPLVDLAPEAALLASWMLNVDNTSAAVISNGSGLLSDVQSAELAEVEGVTYVHVQASGIPSYETTISQNHIDFLGDRARQAHDFVSGSPILELEDQISFGEDIGYRSTGCTDVPGSGYGYWPPGPACPTSQDWDAWFPMNPIEADTHAATGLGAIGLWVNGTAVFNWSDGQSWQQERVWWNMAPAAEAYDLDICPGHSAMGTYHHHSNPTCLADQLGYDWYHSPIYGFAADGVPIAGPWVSDNTLARSSWRVRDYVDPDSTTGCGVTGKRTCLLVDQTDPALGTVDTNASGPDLGTTVISQSGNTFTADAGWFMQDWYYDETLNDGSPIALDEHNGHVGNLPGFSEPRYHYHVTQEQSADGSLVDVFPYYVGPTFWGELH
ncbi:MAG: YHYH protein, partial [Acidimicrobiia bacterium]|nr:YHYH protein [Acidimicrobiia bacterium]